MALPPLIPTYNPYQQFDQLFVDGLDYIATNYSSGQFEDLITTILDYLATLHAPFHPNDELNEILRLVMTNSANDYINTKISSNLNFGGNETAFIDSILTGIRENSTDSLRSLLYSSYQPLAELSADTLSKASVYQALTLAEASNTYWQSKVDSPGSWSSYFNSNYAANYVNIPIWVSASFVATFSGYAQVQAPDVVGADLHNNRNKVFAELGGLSAALVVTAGKVIFRWAKRPIILSAGQPFLNVTMENLQQ